MFIKFTRNNGSRILINTDLVLSMYEIGYEDGTRFTRITMTHDYTYDVIESLKEIEELLEDVDLKYVDLEYVESEDAKYVADKLNAGLRNQLIQHTGNGVF